MGYEAGRYGEGFDAGRGRGHGSVGTKVLLDAAEAAGIEPTKRVAALHRF
jgi:hypothetical protein